MKYIKGFEFKDDIVLDSYLNKLPVVNYLKNINFFAFDNSVTFLVGENGTGK